MLKDMKHVRALPVMENLEGRQLFAAAELGSTVNVGDVGTYIGTADIRTSLKGQVRPTAITITIKTRDKKTNHITGTIQIGKKLTFDVKGALRQDGHLLSFAFSKAKLGFGIFSGKVRKHLHEAEGRITIRFAKFSQNVLFSLIPSPSSSTGTTLGNGTAATNPPATLTFPGGTTTGTTTGTGGSIFG